MGTISKINLLQSEINDTVLEEFVKVGTLAPQEAIGWRPALGERCPQPASGEVVVFTDHIEWGFTPPDSKNSETPCTFLISIPRLRPKLHQQPLSIPSIM